MRAREEGQGQGQGQMWHANGNGMAIALMASSVSLCRHYAALSASRREQSATGHIHAGQLPKALSLLTHTHKRTHTRGHLHSRLSRLGDIIATITCTIVILSTQNGRS